MDDTAGPITVIMTYIAILMCVDLHSDKMFLNTWSQSCRFYSFLLLFRISDTLQTHAVSSCTFDVSLLVLSAANSHLEHPDVLHRAETPQPRELCEGENVHANTKKLKSK